VLEEEGAKVELSEIEEGHESGISEADEETEVGGEDSTYEENPASSSLLLDSDAKMMAIFTERIELRTDSESSETGPILHPHSKSKGPRDPISFFTTTVSDLRSPDTDTSGLEDFVALRSSDAAVGGGSGTTDADSSIEFQRGSDRGKFVREGTTDSARMTSSGDSLDEQQHGSSGILGSEGNIMQVSKDSLDLEETGIMAQQMTDSLQGRLEGASGGGVMVDSLELSSGQQLPGASSSSTYASGSKVMSESVDSLTGRSVTEETTAMAAGSGSGSGRDMLTSTDSLEGGQGIAEGTLSTSSSTAADAAMWSSTGGSISTLVSSQEDLTLENQF
jgi:hypothetical protein